MENFVLSYHIISYIYNYKNSLHTLVAITIAASHCIISYHFTPRFTQMLTAT